MDEKTTLRILNETINRKMGLPKEIVRTPSLAAGDLVVLYALLTEDRALTQSEIARFLFRPRQTINSSLQRMQQQGLLELQADKGRKKKILLTEKGREITRQYVDPVFQLELRALSRLSRREQEQFSGLLIKFGDAIEQETALQKKAKNLSQKSRSGQNPAGAFTGR